MARTWLSVTVELLGGRGEELWPWPGRVFAVAPSHMFLDLADAINDAFARLDRVHLSLYTLADGRVVTDDETGRKMAAGSFGPIVAPVDIESAKVGRMLSLGAEFQYTFDLADDWVHRCVVGDRKIDPLDALGIVPDKPLPYWGWGTSRTSAGGAGRTTTAKGRCRSGRGSGIPCSRLSGPPRALWRTSTSGLFVRP